MIFKFCPNCKSKLTKLSERLVDCKKCGFHFYINPASTNGVIFENDKNEILLVKRKVDPNKGYFDLPGGFIEYRETAEESVKREVKEELCISIDKFTYFMSVTDRYLYKNLNYHTLCFIFIAKISNEKIKASDDISEIKFFKKNEIPFDKIAFKGIVEALKKYLKS